MKNHLQSSSAGSQSSDSPAAQDYASHRRTQNSATHSSPQLPDQKQENPFAGRSSQNPQTVPSPPGSNQSRSMPPESALPASSPTKHFPKNPSAAHGCVRSKPATYPRRRTHRPCRHAHTETPARRHKIAAYKIAAPSIARNNPCSTTTPRASNRSTASTKSPSSAACFAENVPHQS